MIERRSAGNGVEDVRCTADSVRRIVQSTTTGYEAATTTGSWSGSDGWRNMWLHWRGIHVAQLNTASAASS